MFDTMQLYYDILLNYVGIKKEDLLAYAELLEVEESGSLTYYKYTLSITQNRLVI
jgi:hypothetical protein